MGAHGSRSFIDVLDGSCHHGVAYKPNHRSRSFIDVLDGSCDPYTTTTSMQARIDWSSDHGVASQTGSIVSYLPHIRKSTSSGIKIDSYHGYPAHLSYLLLSSSSLPLPPSHRFFPQRNKLTKTTVVPALET